MRLLSVVLQNKKGENVVIATSPSIHTRTCILHSNFIYEYILQTYRRRLKIERSLTLQPNLNCVLSVNKDYILYIFVQKNDLTLAFDAVKKVTDFFNSNLKMFAGMNGAARLDTVARKFVEFMSNLEEFLYTREITVRDYLPMLPQPASKRKNADQEILNKFAHIAHENDRKIIVDSQLLSSAIEGKEVRRKSHAIEQAKKLVVKSQDEFDLLQADPEKENFLNHYRRHLIHFAACGRRRQMINSVSLQELSEHQIETEQLLEEHELIEEPQREKIKLKMNEKLQLSLQNAKIKEVLQYGQILVEGTQKQTALIKLGSAQTTWNNPQLINKRITPLSLAAVTDLGTQMKFNTEAGYKSMPLIDYIIRKESFSPEKVPLLFVYSRQVSSSNIEFTFKYKLNDKWRHRLYDVDISVFLHREFVVMDCKSVPSAYSLKNNKITWKTKEILPNSANSKGKIILAFGGTNVLPKEIIREVKLTMKANCGLVEGLQAECQQEWGYGCEAERMLLIEYKISPNEEMQESGVYSSNATRAASKVM